MDRVYKIVMSISRHSISYEYLRIGGGGALQPMANLPWPQPLAFFCQDNGNIIIGDGALYAVRSGTKNAFDDYFGKLSEGLIYTVLGQQQSLSVLLLDASELLFREFFTSVLFNSYGPLDSNRNTMPLIIVCESDIGDNERAHVKELFKNRGYARVAVEQYDHFIEEQVRDVLSRQDGCDYVVSVLCDGDDMTLTLIDRVHGMPRRSKRYPKLGIDPRVEYVSNQVWQAIIYQNGFLDKNREWQIIQQTAKDFLDSGDPWLSSKVKLSDGNEYSYNLTQHSFTIAFEQDRLIAEAVDGFLAESGIRSKDRIMLLLRGNAADNDYFNAILRRGFDHNKVKPCDKIFIEQINNRIIAFPLPMPEDNDGGRGRENFGKINVKPPQELTHPTADENAQMGRERDQCKTNAESLSQSDCEGGVTCLQPTQKQIGVLKRKFRECKATIPGLVNKGQYNDARAKISALIDECNEVNYVELIPDLKALMKEIPAGSRTETEPTGDLRVLKRKWQEVKADANAKKRVGRLDEARSVLEQFLAECKSAGATDLENDVAAAIAAITPTKTKSHIQADTVPSSYPVCELTALLKDGKYDEARTLYKKNGDEDKVSTLTKIIRSKRSLDIRQRTLEECRKVKNMQQIASIIKEIDEHIKLCQSIGASCDDAKRLRKEYRNIK